MVKNNPLTTVEYKGYFIDIDEANLEYKIRELVREVPPKYKVRRRVNGWGIAYKNGPNKAVYPFKDLNHLHSHYRNFIDNHIVPWKNSVNNPLNK